MDDLMKKGTTIPSWLEGWHSEYPTCLDVWQELKSKALSHHLSQDQICEVESMMHKYSILHSEIALVDSEEHRREHLVRLRDELFPLSDQIRDYWNRYGYIDLRVIENGKVGMCSIHGGIALHPEYDDINFTYDKHEFFYMSIFPVKKEGKWGLVNTNGEILLPFEYDFIFRKPDSICHYILIKSDRQGMANIDNKGANIVIPAEMDAVYYVSGWDISLFTKEGKWGWWWYDNSSFYHNYSQPEYDQILIQPIQEVWEMDDDDDEIIVARKGDSFYDFLYWTGK